MKKAMIWLPSLLWMGLIFLMSAMPGDLSSAQSGAILEFILHLLERIFPSGVPVSPDTLHLLIRKAAHMAEYAVLALLNLRALRLSGAKRPALHALLITAAYAATDEYHQSFVDDRGPSAMDVLIDASGAMIALASHRIVSRLRTKRI